MRTKTNSTPTPWLLSIRGHRQQFATRSGRSTSPQLRKEGRTTTPATHKHLRSSNRDANARDCMTPVVSHYGRRISEVATRRLSVRESVRDAPEFRSTRVGICATPMVQYYSNQPSIPAPVVNEEQSSDVDGVLPCLTPSEVLHFGCLERVDAAYTRVQGIVGLPPATVALVLLVLLGLCANQGIVGWFHLKCEIVGMISLFLFRVFGAASTSAKLLAIAIPAVLYKTQQLAHSKRPLCTRWYASRLLSLESSERIIPV
jgi:hypothetical protein